MNGSMKGSKSHDYHVLMQQVFPLCIRSVLAKEVHIAIIMLRRVFMRIYTKTIDPSIATNVRSNMAIALYMMEKK